MATSLLTSDKNLFEELGLALDLNEEAKLSYVKEQINQINMILWRNRVDLLINDNIETKSDEQRDQLATKSKEFQRDIKNYSRALKVLYALQEELENGKE